MIASGRLPDNNVQNGAVLLPALQPGVQAIVKASDALAHLIRSAD